MAGIRGFHKKSAEIGRNIVGIPRGWKWKLQGSCRNGICFAGNPWGHFRSLANYKNYGASVRILGKPCVKCLKFLSGY